MSLLRILLLTVIAACHTAEPTPWAQEVASLDRTIAAASARVDARPAAWIEAERLVVLLRQRARLTGDYDNFVVAEDALDRAFASAPAGGGPLLARAELHLSLHRLEDAQRDIDTVAAQPLHTSAQLHRLDQLRADLALQRGDLELAESLLRDQETRRPSLSSAAGLARLAWKRGDLHAADALFVQAGERYHAERPEPRAWVHLQRGLLDLERADYTAALEHYDEADRILGGWWLITEHRAEATAELGRTDEAIALYREAVASSEEPEVMRALADLTGAPADADLRTRADAVQARRLARFPEAVRGHAH